MQAALYEQQLGHKSQAGALLDFYSAPRKQRDRLAALDLADTKSGFVRCPGVGCMWCECVSGCQHVTGLASIVVVCGGGMGPGDAVLGFTALWLLVLPLAAMLSHLPLPLFNTLAPPLGLHSTRSTWC
jgi:hypothetical protein